jgi:DDE superfamily endonuclease
MGFRAPPAAPRRPAAPARRWANLRVGVHDRLLVTLAHLRTGLTHEALGVIDQVGSSTIGRAICESRPPGAGRGFAVPQRPGLRLGTLADLVADAEAENVTLRIDGAEPQVRRPKAGRPGRAAFVSGKRKQHTIKTTTSSDGQGRTLWCGAVRPGRMHDQTAMRTEGIAAHFRRSPRVNAEVDDGDRGLANEFPDQVSAPSRKPKHLGEGAITEPDGWRQAKRRQSSQRIAVEHANAELRQWRPLQRWTGRRQDDAEPHCAIAGLVCDRAAKRAARHRPSTELVPAFPTDCCTVRPTTRQHALPQSRGRSLVGSGEGVASGGAAVEHGSGDAGSGDQAARSEHGEVLADRSGGDGEALGECGGGVRFGEGGEQAGAGTSEEGGERLR